MTWTWDYITLVYAAILIIFLIIGYVRGFSKVLLAFVGTLASFIISFFLAKPIGNALFNQFGSGLTGTIDNAIVSKIPELGQPIAENASDILKTYLTQLGIPEAFQNMLSPKILALIPEGATDIVLSTYIATSVSSLVFLIGTYIVLFIVLMIVFAILKVIFGKLVKTFKVVHTIDKLLGMLVMACVAVIIIAVISYGLTFVVSLNNGAGDWIIAQLHLNDDAIMTPSKWIYQYNILQRLFNLYF